MPLKAILKRPRRTSKDAEIRKLRRAVEGHATQLAEVKQRVQALQAEMDHIRARIRG